MKNLHLFSLEIFRETIDAVSSTNEPENTATRRLNSLLPKWSGWNTMLSLQRDTSLKLFSSRRDKL